MDIRVESVKFDADKKLLAFIHDKVGKLERFFDAIIGVEVTLSLVPGHETKRPPFVYAFPAMTCW